MNLHILDTRFTKDSTLLRESVVKDFRSFWWRERAAQKIILRWTWWRQKIRDIQRGVIRAWSSPANTDVFTNRSRRANPSVERRGANQTPRSCQVCQIKWQLVISPSNLLYVSRNHP